MDPKIAEEILVEYNGISVEESDLDPEDDAQGRAQFLVTLINDEESVEEYLDDTPLEIFNTDSSPNHFRHIALPPE